MNYPLWLEILLAISMAVALMGLGAWMLFTTLTKALNAAARLEDKRTNSAWMLFTTLTKALNAAARLEDKRTNRETDALNTWKTAYEAEHAEHLQDVADLTNEILTLKREIEVKNLVLSKAKVADL